MTNVFCLPWRSSLFMCHVDHHCEESMVFHVDSSNNDCRDITLKIMKRGGCIINDYLDDPHSIIVGNKESESGVSTNYDRFDIQFIVDSFEAQKLKDLNQYLIKPSLFLPYDANQILHRRLKWSDVKRKDESRSRGRPSGRGNKASQSRVIDSGSQNSSKLNTDGKNVNISKSIVKIQENASTLTENCQKVVNSSKTTNNDEENSSGSKPKTKETDVEVLTVDEIGNPLEITDDEEEESSHSVMKDVGQDKPSSKVDIMQKHNKSPEVSLCSVCRSPVTENPSTSKYFQVKQNKNSSQSAVKDKIICSPRLNVTEKEVDSSKPSCSQQERSSGSSSKSLGKRVEVCTLAEISLPSPVKTKQILTKSAAKEKTIGPISSTPLKKPNMARRDSSDDEAISSWRTRKSRAIISISSDSDFEDGPATNTGAKMTSKLPRLEGTSVENPSKQSKGRDHLSKSSIKVINKCSLKLNAKTTLNNSTELIEEISQISDTLSRTKETTLIVTRSKDAPTEKSAQSAVQNKTKDIPSKSAGINGPSNRPTSSESSTSRTSIWVSEVVARRRDSSSPEPVPPKKRKIPPPESSPGSPVSSFSSVSEHNISVANNRTLNNTTNNTTKTIRREYTERDRLTILKYIVDYGFYNYTRGNKIWMYLEHLKLLPGRTHESMKEHFRKQIQPNIKNFKLDDAVLKQFEKAKYFLDHNKGKCTIAPIDLERWK